MTLVKIKQIIYLTKSRKVIQYPIDIGGSPAEIGMKGFKK
jgi:hypothetical protein